MVPSQCLVIALIEHNVRKGETMTRKVSRKPYTITDERRAQLRAEMLEKLERRWSKPGERERRAALMKRAWALVKLMDERGEGSAK